MSNVVFKKGLLDNLSSAALVDGQILITTDEQAIYLDHDFGGTKGLQRIRLGDTVRVTQSWATFQADTQGNTKAKDAIYYIAAENILCAWDGTRWKQINAQKEFTEYVSAFITSLDTDGGQITITQALKNGNDVLRSTNYRLVDSSTVKFTQDSSSTTASPAITAESEVDTAKLTATAVTGGTLLSIGTEYKIGNGQANTRSGDNLGNITIKGAGGAAVSLSESNATNTKGTVTITTGKDEYLTYDGEEGILQGKWYASLPSSGTPQGTVYMSGAKLAPKISYGQAGSKTTVKATENSTGNGTSRVTTLTWDLDVYSTSQVDSLLGAVNAMTFKGGLTSTTTALPTSNISIGDTYAVQSGFTIGADQYLPGDIVIASAKDGYSENATTGYLPANGIEWTHVRSGEDVTATYMFNADSDSNQITLIRNNNTYGTINFDNKFTVSSTGSGAGRVVSVGHAASTFTPVTSTSTMVGATATNGVVQMQKTFVTGVTYDSSGHINGLTTETMTITDTRSGITNIANSVDLDVNSAELISTFTLADGSNNKKTSHYIESSSLALSAGTNSNGVAINLVWGSF